jgi:hypothetical protein
VRVPAIAINTLLVGLILVGCGSSPPESVATSVIVTTTVPAPTPTATTDASPADYRLEGTPLQAASDGSRFGHYGFWTDDSHAVAYDVWIFSGDSGGASCEVRVGHAGRQSYALPEGVTSTCTDAGNGAATDGSAVAINYKVFPDPTNVGFLGCLAEQKSDPTVDSARPVLPPDATLTIAQPGFETYHCAVAAATASCSDSAPGSSFTFGMTKAFYHQE